MRLDEIIDLALTVRAWKPPVSNTDFQEDCVKAVALAQKKFHLDAPAAFLPDWEHVVLLPEHSNADMRPVSATSDLWVLSFGTTGVPLGLINPTTDGTWDGIYHIEVQTPDGVWHRRRCREFWVQPGDKTLPNQYLVSLDRPWRNTVDADMPFRLYQPEVFVRNDVDEVLDGKLWWEDRSNLNLLPEAFVMDAQADDFRGTSRGPPSWFYRARREQLDAPVQAPTIGTTVTTWLGPEPAGTFKYKTTYVWGRQDAENLAPGGEFDPLLESGPSPESAVATAATPFGAAIALAFPNIDYQLGFGATGTIRETHSGLRIRIYRARLTVAGSGGTSNIEAPGVYQYLTEIDGSDGVFIDRGSITPDYFRRLPQSTGYFAFRPVPQQDQRYELDLRVRRRPRKLEISSDVLNLAESGVPAFIELVAGEMARLERAFDEYHDHLRTYRDTLLPAYLGTLEKAAGIIPPVAWESGEYVPGGRIRARDLGRFRA